MAKKNLSTADTVWGVLFGLMFLVAGALAMWSHSRGDPDWYVLGIVALIVGWLALGMIKLGWDVSSAASKKANDD